jgi:hypothetical protein
MMVLVMIVLIALPLLRLREPISAALEKSYSDG